jgi:hypothetical protein
MRTLQHTMCKLPSSSGAITRAACRCGLSAITYVHDPCPLFITPPTAHIPHVCHCHRIACCTSSLSSHQPYWNPVKQVSAGDIAAVGLAEAAIHASQAVSHCSRVSRTCVDATIASHAVVGDLTEDVALTAQVLTHVPCMCNACARRRTPLTPTAPTLAWTLACPPCPPTSLRRYATAVSVELHVYMYISCIQSVKS